MDTHPLSLNLDLSLEQLAGALKRLPEPDKVALWRMLDHEIDRPAIAGRFDLALQKIRAASRGIDEAGYIYDKYLEHNEEWQEYISRW